MWESSDNYCIHEDFEALDEFMHDASSEPDDCFLSEDALKQVSIPPQEKWTDFLSSENPAIITLDDSKVYQWDLAKKEIVHIREATMNNLGGIAFDDVDHKMLLMQQLGPSSKIATYLQDNLGLSKKEYMQFMGTYCLQSAYLVSSTQLFSSDSSLKNDALMNEREYNGIWKQIATARKVEANHISTSRREAPLWEELERITNTIMRKISITGRRGRVSIALDDDKIWGNFSNSASMDLFNLKYQTHVKANRKGLVAHTAVSTGVNMPIGIVMERAKDNTAQCFKRLLDFLFSQDGETNLRNVTLHSDRGYMVPNLVFEYLIKHGAEFVGTIKRMLQCYPYTYAQTIRPTDKRTLIDENGHPTLYLKWTKAGYKHVFASAFRNGSKSVATAISSLHNQHHWEGIVLKPLELHSYRRDNRSLQSLFFQRVMDIQTQLGCIDYESEEELSSIDDLFTVIEPYTLRQGKCLLH